jgi:hypothetical protein
MNAYIALLFGWLFPPDLGGCTLWDLTPCDDPYIPPHRPNPWDCDTPTGW